MAEAPVAMTPLNPPLDEDNHASSNTSDAASISKDTATENETSAPRARSRAKAIGNMVVLNASILVAALDETIISTALPTITADLHSSAGYSWVAGSYLLATAVAAPIITRLSDIWGRKPIILATSALFFVSSMICALSVNMAMLIAGRALLGIGGGGFMGLVGIITADLFSERERTVHYTIQMLIWSVASATGPLMGGVFAQKISWRWCFWINLPVSGITFVALLICLDTHNPRTPLRTGLKALDWVGSLLMLGFVIMFLFGFQFGGNTFAWDSSTVICLIVFGVIVGVLFFVYESRSPRQPILPMEVILNRSNAASILVGCAHSFVSLGPIFYIPLYLQSAKEVSPLRSGIILLAFTLADAASSILTGVCIKMSGDFYVAIWAGTALLTISSGLFLILDATTTLPVIIGLLVVSGFAAGILFQPILLATQAHARRDHVAIATATLGSARTVAGAMSVVLGSVVFEHGMDSQASNLRAAGASIAQLQEFAGNAASANSFLLPTVKSPTLLMALKVAYADSVRQTFFLFTAIGAFSLVATMFVKRRKLRDDHEETITGVQKE